MATIKLLLLIAAWPDRLLRFSHTPLLQLLLCRLGRLICMWQGQPNS